MAGRYRVLHRLGAGGTAVVYAAHDERLDRRVALKVASSRDDHPVDSATREARALASLSHPNVVTVFDVGAHEGHLFVAMELVEGQTLAGWLAEGPRPWRQVVAAFVQAGRGLAAAHAAGIVHRDFKPSNVLVGRDGRVRVTDFGLARLIAGDGGEPAEASSVSLDGTASYRAPEQHQRGPLDARTDQFSFCAVLHRALTGGGPGPAPSSGRMPRWLGRVLERGMSAAPADRHPSMDVLLRELERDPARRWRKVGVGAGVGGAAALALAVAGALALRSPSGAVCRGAGEPWAGVWDQPGRRAVEKAFLATGKPYAAGAFAEVSRALDAYEQAFTAMYTDACRATRVRRTQPEEMLERRMMCLDGRLRDARALVLRFAAADVELVEKAPRAVRELGDLGVCADVAALASQVAPPAEPRVRAQLGTLRGQLADLKSMRIQGRIDAARARARQLLPEIERTRYRPLEAELLHELGLLEQEAGDAKQAKASLEKAVWAAEASRLDELAAQSWLRLMSLERHDARYREGLALEPRVTALIARLGGSDELSGALAARKTPMLQELGRYPEAQAEARRAVQLLERRFGPRDLRVADAYVELGGVMYEPADRRQAAEATGYVEKALAIKREVYAADHPEVARTITSVATALSMENKYQQAADRYGEALAMLERVVHPQHPDIAKVSYNQALVWESLGRHDRALALHRRAVAVGAVAFGADHPMQATFLSGLAQTLVSFERWQEALTALEQAVAIIEAKVGPETIRAAFAHETMAEALLFGLRRYGEARAHAQRSLTVHERVMGPGNSNLRAPLLLVGLCDLRLGAAARAVAPLERAVAFGTDGDPGQIAQIEFALARALMESGRDPRRARALALASWKRMAGDDRMKGERARLRVWLKRHAGGGGVSSAE